MVPTLAKNILQRTVQRQSWASREHMQNYPDIHFSIVYIMGANNKSDASKVSSEAAEHRDIIQALFRDTYKNLTLKIQLGLYWASNRCSKVDYIFKTDDDVYINIEALSEFITLQRPGGSFYGGKCLLHSSPIRDKKSKWYMSASEYPKNQYDPFCLGPMYFMSMNVAKRIVPLEKNELLPFLKCRIRRQLHQRTPKILS